LSLLLGVSALYMLYEYGSSFLTLVFGLMIVLAVGRSLWVRTQEAYGAAITVWLIALFVMLAQPEML
jgi:hypothetical protein